ncbi:AP-4 complex subunit epsilon-1-like [Argiope bruennichi]|uniref:AP-4 complex subunit epsilon-1-like n=1 Tax=Argiope bruennichi TaxID=94029 RepID=UPI0024950932|nr:AP-4 complex subunit epsilon-1-like [Argiope bruennichi]
MARFVGKTFESLNSMLSNSGLFINLQDKTSTKFIPSTVDSKSFIRKLRNVDSKQAEEEIIQSYLSAVEKRLSEPDVPNTEIDELIKVCMNCETMGYPAPFIYVHCLKLAQKGNLQEKHTGYSAVSYFLHPHHELVILLINTMQKDLCSSNYVEILYALSSICNLINVDTVHNIFHLVEERLNHEKSSVRKSAILTLGHCLLLIDSQSAYQMSIPKIEKALTDSELEVVSAAVSTLYKIIQKLPFDFTYLIKSLVELQDQILLRRVPRSMVYCDIPAPWLQLDILKLLNLLCKEAEHHKAVTPILKKTLQQVGLHNTLAHAIMYQVIESITCITPCNELVEMILSSVSMFLKSKNVNLKLMGIEGMIVIIKRLKPSITLAQQEIIMECLQLPDETLKLKTLELLFHLANPSNVQAICKKLMEFLTSSTKVDKKKELAMKILQLSEKFSDKQEWFISISLSVLMEAGDLLPTSELNRVINIISKDSTLKEIAKKSCLQTCREEKHRYPSIIKLTASVLSTLAEFEEILPIILPHADEEASTWVLVSLTEILLKSKEISSSFTAFLKTLEVKNEYPTEVLKQLLQIVECLGQFPDVDLNEEVDPSLTFLDGFVVEALENNKSCYLPSSYRVAALPVDESTAECRTESLDYSEVSFAHDSVYSPSQKSPTYSEFSSPSTSFQSLIAEKDLQPPFTTKSPNIWTEEGRKSIKNKQGNSLEVAAKATDKEQGDDLKNLFAGVS